MSGAVQSLPRRKAFAGGKDSPCLIAGLVLQQKRKLRVPPKCLTYRGIFARPLHGSNRFVVPPHFRAVSACTDTARNREKTLLSRKLCDKAGGTE